MVVMPAAAQEHQHAHPAEPTSAWHFMQDGVIYGLFNHQGGPRGGNEAKAPNWWMGMVTRRIGSSQLTLNTMFSLDVVTAGKRGYREIFQVGEAVHGRPLIDRQHPHDLFMQLAAVWRVPVTASSGLTIAGGPAGEPALGPVAFMHRASAAEYPFATLSHHIFDSTHIAFGVITAAVDHGPWVVEGSLFNGREPDEHRWDFDFGKLDSVSTRVWYRPTENWELQASIGRLVDPEELEPGNAVRTTASVSWLKRDASDFGALTIGYGANATDHGTRHAVFGEGARYVGGTSLFTRAEVLQVETFRLLNDAIPPAENAAEQRDIVSALTFGGVRNVLSWRGLDGGIGAAISFYGVPDALKATHGSYPVSFQVFFRLRPPVGESGRMWNMRMAEPMAAHAMTMNHR
jgi:hypothetical protein